MLAIGGLVHIVTNLDHQIRNRLAPCGDIGQQSIGEGAVLAAILAVIGHCTGAGRKGHKGARPAVKLRKSRAARRAQHCIGHGFVAARVKEQQQLSRPAFQLCRNIIKPPRFAVDRFCVGQSRIDRDQMVHTILLKSMSGIIKQHRFRVFGLIRKAAQDGLKHFGANIGQQCHLKAKIAQRLGHFLRISGRRGQSGQIFISLIANNKRKFSRFGGCHKRQSHQQGTKKCTLGNFGQNPVRH